MYLSRVELNLSSRETMLALDNLNKFHGAVESSFDSNRTHRNLWRIDDLNGKKYVLILSETQPNLENFCKQFGFIGNCATKDYSILLNRISNGSKWNFRLTANPSYSKSCGDKTKRGKKLSHVSAEFQKKWLFDRAEKYGFKLEEKEFQSVRNRKYRFYKGEKGKYSVSFTSVTFEGALTVTDEEKFRETLCKGIGREKAYGQGLLTVIRA